MPTFQRLREKHPDAEMKWFARGKLWSSPEEARNRPLDRPAGASNEGGFRQRQRPPAAGGARGKGPKDREPAPAAAREARGRDWRPGGGHRDPRQKYADAKKARNADHRKRRFERKHGDATTRPGSASEQDRPPRKDSWRDRPPAGAKSGGPPFPDRRGAPKADWRDRDRPRGDAGARPAFSGGQDRPPRKDSWRDRPPAGPKGGGPPFPDRRGAPKADWRDRDRPRGDAGARPAFSGGQDRPPRKDSWRDRPPAAPRVAVHPSPIAAARPRPIGAIVTGPAVTPGHAPPSVEGRIGHHGRTRGATARPPAPRAAVRPSPIAAARPRPIGAIVIGPAVTPGHARPSVEGRIGHHGRTRGATARPPAPRAVPPFPDRGGAPKADWRDRDRPRGDAGARPAFSGGQIGHHGRTRGATARPPAPRAAVRPSPIAAARPRPTGAIVIGPAVTLRPAPPSVGDKAIVETRERAEPNDRSCEGGLGVSREPMNHLPRSGHEVPTANRTRERTRSRRRHRVRASRQSCLPAHQSEAGARGRTGGDRASRPVPSARDAPQGGAGRTRRRLIRVSSRDPVDSSCSSGTTCHARPGVPDADALALSVCGTARVR